jgi:lysozyme
MTPEGVSLLGQHEGNVLYAYQDSKGFWTIGKGHCIDKRVGGNISQDIADLLFERDIEKATTISRNLDFFDYLDPVRQDVIIMLVFNMGIGEEGGGGLLSFKLMLKAIREKSWHEAAFQLANSDWGRIVGYNRKVSLCDALEKGAW